MSLLTFPDVNVWLAVVLEDHVHRETAKRWWSDDRSDTLAFVRFTQIAVLRVLTTAAAMNEQPLSMAEAWAAYDRLYEDDRVAFLKEPDPLEARFRHHASLKTASPKLWADAFLLAFADCAGGTIVTFDRALARRAGHAVLLTPV